MATRKPKVKVESVEKVPMSSSGNTEPGDYEDFIRGRNLENLFGGAEMTRAQLRRFIHRTYPDLHIPYDAEVDDIYDLVREQGEGISDNTYNWGYWGPVLDFIILGNATEDPYSDGVILVKRHLGGDVRGNYAAPVAFRLESYAEEVPWYDVNLYVEIKTNKGVIKLDAENPEAYTFNVYEDETGTFKDDSYVKYDDLTRELNWEDAPDLWS